MADVSMEEDLPLTQQVMRIAKVSTTETDRLGNEIVVEIEQDNPVLVFSHWIVSSDEPVLAGHERLIVDARMIAKTGEFSSTDVVKLPGITDSEGELVKFTVVGRGENVDHNPWLFVGREIVNLKEVSG